ncbi:uncharacterized protein [Dermacentor albipictus]|uniref:uncharacterized protein n=1 Tax=Dermacentor albipictus TaxID=60249 RepID=UPI0038FC37D2
MTKPEETATAPRQARTSVMTNTLGSLAEFCPDSGNIEVYLERFDLYATANGIDSSKKLQVFLTILGEKAYVTLRSLLLPKKPTEVKYEEATEALRKHYAPKRSVVTERYHFYQRKQEPDESLKQFIVELKRLAATCSFGSFLEEALRDRLIAGLRTDSIRCRLLALSDDEVTWERVCKIATALETAQKDTREMLPEGSTASPADVYWHREPTTQGRRHATKTASSEQRAPQNGPRKQRGKGIVRACHGCGGLHAPVSCPFLKSTCFKCSKPGHVAKMCKTKVVHKVKETLPSTDLLTVSTTNQVHSSPPIVLKVKVNGKEIPMELDTGAAVTIMSERDFDENFPNYPCSKDDVRLGVYNGTALKVKGVAKVNVSYQNRSYDLPLIVAKQENEARMPTLLGRDWMTTLKVDLQNAVQQLQCDVDNVQEGRQMVAAEAEKKLKQLYGDVFEPGYGSIKGFTGSIRMKTDVHPTFCKARPVPYALREQVENELRDLEKAGVVYRVRHSDWATPLVVVPKKTGKEIRICGDYRVTVNRDIELDHYPLPLPEDIFASLVGGTVFTLLDLSKAYLQLELDEQAQQLLTVNTHMGLFRFRRLPRRGLSEKLLSKYFGPYTVLRHVSDVNYEVIPDRDLPSPKRRLPRPEIVHVVCLKPYFTQ